MDTYKIAWNQALEIGDPGIDDQHKNLIELIASIPEHDSNKGRAALDAALDYVEHHFAEEEAIMERVGFPLLHAHRNKHKKLTRVLMTYKKEFEEGTEDIYAFREFMFCWIRDHIMEDDQILGSYIKGLSNTNLK